MGNPLTILPKPLLFKPLGMDRPCIGGLWGAFSLGRGHALHHAGSESARSKGTGLVRRGTMTKPLWIVQTNLGQTSDIMRFADAIRRSGAPVAEVHHIPFSDRVHDVRSDSASILNGSVNFVAAAAKANRWIPGVFGNLDIFCYENWAANYGPLLLNSPEGVEHTTMRCFLKNSRNEDQVVFARPSQDTKSFEGLTMTVAALRSICRTAVSGQAAGLDGDTQILICVPHGIESEFRLFMADGEPIAASSYQKKGRSRVEPGAPPEVLSFARAATARWSPSRLFTLDVCLSAGNPYIVEAQSFNMAGHYAADMDVIVDAANQIALDMYGKAS